MDAVVADVLGFGEVAELVAEEREGRVLRGQRPEERLALDSAVFEMAREGARVEARVLEDDRERVGRHVLVRLFAQEVGDVREIPSELQESRDVPLSRLVDLVEAGESLDAEGGLEVVHLGVEPEPLEVEIDVAIGPSV